MKLPNAISARSAIAALAVSVALALPSVGSAVAESVLRVANMGEPDTLDPHNASGTWENRILGDMFLGLTTETADGSVIPGAAESWTVSEDGTVYTFKIRDHKWSDGTPVTADDFVFSLRRILNPETAAKYASLLYPIKNAEAVNTGQSPGEQLAVRAVDDRTLEIQLESPTPYFLAQLTHYTAWPVPKHAIEKHGSDWVKKENIASNGAYMLDEYLPNTHVKLVKNSQFYDADNVSIDTIFFYPGEDRAAALKRFRAGEIDVSTDFASDQIDWLRKNMPDQTRIAPYLGIYYYVMNTEKDPFTDPRVRKALSMAIDRETIVDKVMKTGEVAAYSFVPPGTGNYGEPSYVKWKGMSMDDRVAEAQKLLAEAGYGPDNPLKFTLRYNTSENHKRIAIAVSSMWKKLGVQAELFNSEVKVHYNDLQEGDFQIARAGWIADYDDPQNFLYLLETKTGPMNYGNFSNSSFDGLMEEASRTTDLDKRSGLLAQAERVAMDEQANIPIYYYVSKNLVSDRVQGWEDNAKDIHRSRWLSLKD